MTPISRYWRPWTLTRRPARRESTVEGLEVDAALEGDRQSRTRQPVLLQPVGRPTRRTGTCAHGRDDDVGAGPGRAVATPCMASRLDSVGADGDENDSRALAADERRDPARERARRPSWRLPAPGVLDEAGLPKRLGEARSMASGPRVKGVVAGGSRIDRRRDIGRYCSSTNLVRATPKLRPRLRRTSVRVTRNRSGAICVSVVRDRLSCQRGDESVCQGARRIGPARELADPRQDGDLATCGPHPPTLPGPSGRHHRVRERDRKSAVAYWTDVPGTESVMSGGRALDK